MMEAARDPARDYVRFVAEGYDACAEAYNEARSADAADVLAPLTARLPDGARVLDLGCGAGVPIARALSSRFDVVGIDISSAQLGLARRQAPRAQYVRADMRSCAFAPASFDAVVSFYAIFHIPRIEHEALFARVASWLKPNGCMLASVGRTDGEAYTEPFFGVEMYWSHFDAARYREIIERSGLRLLDMTELSHGYRHPVAPEAHPLLFAEKPG